MSKTNSKKGYNFLFFLPDQHRGDWMPYDKETLKIFGMEELPLILPNIKRLMDNGITFTNAITPSPLCAPARACLASGLRYKNCKVASNQVNYPLEQKTYYSVLKENGYSVGSVGKLDLNKGSFFWGIDGWRPDLSELGFNKDFTIDNEGKWDAIISGAYEKGEKGKLILKKREDFGPVGPYMNFLKDNNLIRIHVRDFTERDPNRGNKYNTSPTNLSSEYYCDNWITKNGIKILKQFPKERPWHLVVNFVCPHEPWDVTKEMKKKWENVKFPEPNQGNNETVEEELKVRQNYAAMLENIDRNIGLMIEEVEKRGELDNTIIIYSSDHGETLGDFSKYGKRLPERGSVRIPLIISGPEIEKGMFCDQLIELQDITATIIEFAGCLMPEAKDSISLKNLLKGYEKKHREFQISALDLREWEEDEWKMISDGRYKLIVENGKNKRLYDLKSDPWENKDISEFHPGIIQNLLKKLNSEC